MRATRSSLSRTTRPRPVGSATSAVRIVAAASCSAVLGREPGDRLRPHERRVAGQHEDVVFGVEIVEARVSATLTASPVPRCTRCSTNSTGTSVTSCSCSVFGDPLGAVPDDDDDALERQLGERVDDVQHHRPAAQLVQHLRRPRPHPRALAGGEHDCGERSVLAHDFSIGSAHGLVHLRGRWLGGEGSNLD